jgi:uncharacterized protein
VPTNGEKPDYPEALRLFKIAAAKGNGLSMANVGWMYENGLGVPQDVIEAMKWYRRALDAG